DLLNFFPWKTHAIDRTGGKVFHHYVTLLDQFREYLFAYLSFWVQRNAALVAVQHCEIETVDTGLIAQLPPRRISFTRSFNLDNIGAEPRQNLGARRSRLHVRHIQDPNTLQSFTHGHLSLSARCRAYTPRHSMSYIGRAAYFTLLGPFLRIP